MKQERPPIHRLGRGGSIVQSVGRYPLGALTRVIPGAPDKIGVSTGCDGRIGFHVKALVRLGATREQHSEIPAVAVYMGGVPSLLHAADALRAFDECERPSGRPNRPPQPRWPVSHCMARQRLRA